MMNTYSAPRSGRVRGRLVFQKPSLCSGLPLGLRRLLARDAATVIGLCLRPKGLSLEGEATLRFLLKEHARTNAAARAALDVINRREIR